MKKYCKRGHLKNKQNKYRRDCQLCRNIRRKEFLQRHPDYRHEYNLVHRHNMTVDEYRAQFKRQKGCCAVCHKPESRKDRNGGIKRLAVDHNHKTNTNRDLLCVDCNTALGLLRENISVLKAMIAYLNRWRK